MKQKRNRPKETSPNREEIYRRVSRFVEHCNRLGVPHLYSIYNIYRADDTP
ncbi:MAG TPA: hypothetical protein VK469_06650 [Candidatus Kapabacteria bacterium]|nr:hypothetical protein [Candidatus Kapabacteria bacterium]